MTDWHIWGDSAAAGQVRAFVSGLPGERSRLRNLMVLQVCIDGSGPNPRYFCLAGYIATAEAWTKFAADWENLLEENGLTVFKFTLQQSNIALCEKFYRIIEGNNIVAATDCVIDLLAIKRVIDVIQWPSGCEALIRRIRNPFFLASKALMRNLVVHSDKLGMQEPIDFIFDYQSEVPALQDAWNVFKGSFSHKNAYKLGNSPPAFKTDDEFNPLQAADLLAGSIRKAEEYGRGSADAAAVFPWDARKTINRMFTRFNDEMLREEFEFYIDPENIRQVFELSTAEEREEWLEQARRAEQRRMRSIRQ